MACHGDSTAPLDQRPFIDISARGPQGVFPAAKTGALGKTLAEIRQRAAA